MVYNGRRITGPNGKFSLPWQLKRIIGMNSHILQLGDIDQAVVQPAEEKGAVARADDGGHWNEGAPFGRRTSGNCSAATRSNCLQKGSVC